MKRMYVYIMTNESNTTLYIGVTNDLIRRVWEHKNHVLDGFTAQYNMHKLVYFETYEDELAAIEREKQLKSFKRQKKIDMICQFNSMWIDLYSDICK